MEETGVKDRELVDRISKEKLITLFIQQIFNIYLVPRARISVVREVVTC